jgi:hypothetical protein
LIELLIPILILNQTTNILDETPKVEMDVYPKTLSFCYIQYDKDKEHNKKIAFVVCNYVEMSQKKLESVRDYLEDWTK